MNSVQKAAQSANISCTDADILAFLAEGRNIAANIKRDVDASENHIYERLKKLQNRGLIRQIGTESTHLYELTKQGYEAIEAWQELQTILEEED